MAEEDMNKTTFDAKAKAIDDSSIVLLFISADYKNSPECKKEAESAYMKKKTLIPIFVESKYKPDGWLGALVGANRFYGDFSGNYDFDKIYKKLFKVIQFELNYEGLHEMMVENPCICLQKCEELFPSLLKVVREDIEKNRYYTENVKSAVSQIYTIINFKRSMNIYEDEKSFITFINNIRKENGFSNIVKLVVYYIDSYLSNDKYDGSIITCKELTEILVILTANSEQISEEICGKDELIDVFVRLQTQFAQKRFLQLQLDKDFIDILRNTITIPYNCLKFDCIENASKLRQKQMLSSVTPLLETKHDDKIKPVALLFLDYIAIEDEANTYLTESKHIEYFINLLKEAFHNPQKKTKNGFRSIELGRGIERLAKNDAIKRRLVEQGIIPILELMINSKMAEECEIAFLIIWTLSFEKQNKLQIHIELGTIIHQFSVDRNEFHNDIIIRNVETARFGAMFVLNQKEDAAAQKPVQSLPGKHVMISYCHKNMDIVFKVDKELKNKGVQTWIDTDKMRGSTLEAMAKAVEDSAIFLFFISSDYKNSQACQTEAEYAYKNQKNLIPILVEPKYKADGWLGAVIGAKLYYDFSGKNEFNKIFEELMKVIPSDLNSKDAVRVENIPEFDYTADEVKEWLRINGFKEKLKIPLTGADIKYMKKWSTEDPPRFHDSLEKSVEFSERGKFNELLEKF